MFVVCGWLFCLLCVVAVAFVIVVGVVAVDVDVVAFVSWLLLLVEF